MTVFETKSISKMLFKIEGSFIQLETIIFFKIVIIITIIPFFILSYKKILESPTFHRFTNVLFLKVNHKFIRNCTGFFFCFHLENAISFFGQLPSFFFCQKAWILISKNFKNKGYGNKRRMGWDNHELIMRKNMFLLSIEKKKL